VILLTRPPFHSGNMIEVGDHTGTVHEINLRTTILRSMQGQLVHIPNSNVIQNPIVNYSTGRRRIDLAVGVSYGDDLNEVRRVTIEAIDAVSVRDREHDVEFFFEAFGESAILLVVRFWISFQRQVDFLAARSEAIIRIRQAYARNGITIPFPIRTLDFGIKGGEALREQIEALTPPPDRQT
jgi:small conductance mechanosensitive channel